MYFEALCCSHQLVEQDLLVQANSDISDAGGIASTSV